MSAATVKRGQVWVPREQPDAPPAEVMLCLEIGDGKSWSYHYETDVPGDPRRHRFGRGEEPAPEAGETARWLWYPRGTNLLEVSIDSFDRFEDRAACVADAWKWGRSSVPAVLTVEEVGATTTWLRGEGRRITMPTRTLVAGWELEAGEA